MKTIQQHIDKKIIRIAEVEEKIKSATGKHRKRLVNKVLGWKMTLKYLQKLAAWGIVRD